MLEGVAWARALSEAPAAAASTATAAAHEDSQVDGASKADGQHATRLVRRPAASQAPKSDVRKIITLDCR